MKRRTFFTRVVGALAVLPLIRSTAWAQAQDQKETLINNTRKWAADCKQLDEAGQSILASWNQISSTITSPTDFVGTNSGLTKTQMTAVMTTVGNMHTEYIAGNNTNVETFLKPVAN